MISRCFTWPDSFCFEIKASLLMVPCSNLLLASSTDSNIAKSLSMRRCSSPSAASSFSHTDW